MRQTDVVDEINDLLLPGAVQPAYQPIVRLSDGTIIGYEALARMPLAPVRRPPSEWLSRAGDVGLRTDLDRSLISGVDANRSRRALVWSLVAFAREVGSTVIAEGVERAEELSVLRDAGVHLGQGFLLGRPGEPWPAPSLRVGGLSPTRVAEAVDEHDRFQRALRAALDQDEAATAACEHLYRWGQLMPSVYVVHDGLLGCLAQRGYWQILDGIPLGVGVVSQVMRTGDTVVVRGVEESSEFLEATPGIVEELAVPLWVDDHVVGGLNVESLSPLTAEAEAEVVRCAGLLAARLAEVGVRRPDSPLARLARTSKELAGLSDHAEVREAVVRMACEVSGMSSALLAEVDVDVDVELKTVETRGPLAAAFRAIPPDDVARLAAMVERVSSCYTAGDVRGRPVAGTETLRAAGAIEVAVLPLVSLGRRTGILVVAHTSAMHLSTDEIEPLELLAAEAGRCLDLAATVAELRYRATRDPLTSLENHSAFHEALQADRRAYAVAMMDLDGFKAVNDTAGHLTGDALLRSVAQAMSGALRDDDRLYRVGGDEFAAILPGVDAAAALVVGERLCAAAVTVLAPFGASLSVGITHPRPGEAPTTFLDRADRVLYAAKRAARGSASVG